MKIESRIQEILSKIDHPELREACNYALFSGGKRLRPKMTLSISGDAGLDIACAIEFIHTYTLIHDDLPAMDNDDLRRGKPTLHKAFNEATAILTGDLLLTLGFEVISESDFPDSLIVTIIRLLSKKIGANSIIEGQFLDLASQLKPLTWIQYQNIASRKTADLFEVALLAGALIKNISEKEISIYSCFGKAFGLLYQIEDDLQDKNANIDLQQLLVTKKTLLSYSSHLLAQLSTPNQFLLETLKLYRISLLDN